MHSPFLKNENLNLPGLQEEVLKVLVDTGKPVVLVLLSGSALAVGYADKNIPAIVQGWYPGARGGKAIAEILFGDYSPEGKLPVTFYRTTEELPEFTDYSMKNRTYRYMKNEALYPFGFGLSYTDMNCSHVKVEQAGTDYNVSAILSNDGGMDGAETLQVYVKVCRENAPNWQLKALKKVALKAGDKREVSLMLKEDDLGLYNEQGVKTLYAGDYEIYVGTSQPDTRSIALTGKIPEKVTIHVDTEKEIAE